MVSCSRHQTYQKLYHIIYVKVKIVAFFIKGQPITIAFPVWFTHSALKFSSKIIIHPNAHIVTDEHIAWDKKNISSSLGTTSKGIAPCYSDKSLRKGMQAKDCKELLPWVSSEDLKGRILCEGAQGFHLDLDWGNYPYVTSSITLPYGACSLGFSPKKIRNIIGAAKMYDTRSGEDPLFPETLFDNPELKAIADEGAEFGVTTGRRRKVNYLNLDYLKKAIEVGGATHLILSKGDVLEKVSVFKVIFDNKIKTFANISDMKSFIISVLPSGLNVVFSNSPKRI